MLTCNGIFMASYNFITKYLSCCWKSANATATATAKQETKRLAAAEAKRIVAEKRQQQIDRDAKKAIEQSLKAVTPFNTESEVIRTSRSSLVNQKTDWSISNFFSRCWASFFSSNKNTKKASPV